ncbi:MAG: ErfK/YbiS/YcfS/YnhG family protein [Firmicutes bacterium]|nr:ErfK/YbiS/YcfS/YnhG family protein [Bacillota bacterium]
MKWKGVSMIRVINIRSPKMYGVISTLVFFSLLFGIIGLKYMDEIQLSGISDQPSVAPTGSISIVVKIPDHILELYNNGKIYKRYRIAVGKSETPTPIGDWAVIWKSYRAGDIFGTRFLGLDIPWGGYGIHGTNQPWSIGKFVSKGCIRMRNKDIEELFEWVPIGTPVRIEDRAISIQRQLKYESTGADVVQLQRKLRELGYYEGKADGIFNKDTEGALKRFQHDNGFQVTGITDMKLIDALGL